MYYKVCNKKISYMRVKNISLEMKNIREIMKNFRADSISSHA